MGDVVQLVGGAELTVGPGRRHTAHEVHAPLQVWSVEGVLRADRDRETLRMNRSVRRRRVRLRAALDAVPLACRRGVVIGQ